MKSLAALASLLLAIGSTAMPAFARDSYVVDNAHLLSPETISAINAKVGDFAATTHKEVFVDTEPTVDGATPQAAAEKIFAQQQINGVLIYVSKSPKNIGVVPDRAAREFFPPESTASVRNTIVTAFNAGNFNAGITNGVDETLTIYRSHLGALTQKKASYAPVGSNDTIRSSQAGFNLSWIWVLIILAVIFFVIRGIFRAMAGPRMMPPGYGGGGPMMGGGYGPGYGGPGYGGGGGGGSFWSGLMGGLGGAFLGNELFGRRDDFGGGNQAGFVDQGQSQVDNSGFQQDAGQADMGNASFGGWGGGGNDSGSGGGSWGGGGGDGGGWGGGGDGGGGDNSGGGW